MLYGAFPSLHCLFYYYCSASSRQLIHARLPERSRRTDPLLLVTAWFFLYPGYCEMVELLLAKGACIDPLTSCGTPLHVACTEGQDRTVKILLEHNADVSLTS